MQEWKSPTIILGPAATGNYYYERKNIVDDIWTELNKGAFVLMAAPRRVGKTSIMKDIAKYPQENYKVIFKNIQSLKSEQAFYKTIYGLILSCLSTSRKLQSYFKRYVSSKSITEIDVTGNFKMETKEIDYLNEINSIITDIAQDGETVLLLIDELPEVLHYLNKHGKKDEAIGILKNLRVWRQEDRFSKLRFVLAGSIGIGYVVTSIEGRNSDLNDLRKVNCHSLNREEAKDYINWAIANASIQISEEVKDYILTKIEYHIPYFINIVLDEADKLAKKSNAPILSIQDIDEAFTTAIKNNDYFEDWKKRLSDYLPVDDYKFANKILTWVAHDGTITVQNIYDIATSLGKENDYMDIINELEKDGYIVENQNVYSFISPFLKAFWLRKNPIKL